MQLSAPLLTLDLPEATPSNNTIKGMHYRVYAKTRAQWQERVRAALQQSGYKLATPIAQCFLTLERHSAGGGLDWDNAYGGLKPLLDCLVSPSARNPDGLGIIFDDSPKHMPLPPFIKQMPAKRGEGRTVIKIYDAAGLTQDLPSWMQ